MESALHNEMERGESSVLQSGTLKFSKLIHLLYVPTKFCNLGCQYCYLGDQTEHRFEKETETNIVGTLEYALQKFTEHSVLPFNVSLHGGEVTTIDNSNLRQLFRIIERHYLGYMDVLNANNFRKINPHLKTNLYNFEALYNLMCNHKVSISASIDLPLSLHGKYRTTKNGKSSLDVVLKNLQLLGKYPHNAKISSTLFAEHLELTDEIIRDIWFIHHEIGFDMNNFNFMFGFNSALNNEMQASMGRSPMLPVSEETQVSFYQRLRSEFLGTDLEYGFKRNWFDEFTPSYCTCAENCGERFFLLQADGNVFSCVRGQGVDQFYYGNIYHDDVETILNTAKTKVLNIHQSLGFHDDCKECMYLSLCHSGCAYLKNEMNNGKSYTCALQKEIYKDNPVSFAPAKNKEHQRMVSQHYVFNVHPTIAKEAVKQKDIRFRLPNDLYEPKNRLSAIIDDDPVLQELYSPTNVELEFNGNFYPLSSQILKVERTILNIFQTDPVKLHIKKEMFEAHSREFLTNTLYIMLLRDTGVVYGDEKRTKQEHLFTYQIFRNQLTDSNVKGKSYYEFDLTGILDIHNHLFMENTINNLFITTDNLRNYHYQKQKNNAFYHIQAINLPFQNIEFYWNRL